ncbi:MAG: TlpA family protein disulfide reductase [Phycisphaerae bacterium]
MRGKLREKGLVVIGVHEDESGEVDTVAKYGEKMGMVKKARAGWEEAGFAVALTSGEKKEGKKRTSDEHGILYFPIVVLIDREGKVGGKFEGADVKELEGEIGKLLGR